MALTALPNMERVISGSKPPLPILLTGFLNALCEEWIACSTRHFLPTHF